MADATVRTPDSSINLKLGSSACPPHPVLHKYYDDAEDRQRVVTDLFDETALHYDRVIDIMSFWTGGAYRSMVLKRAGVGAGAHILDVACGTGQVSAAAKQLVGPTGRVLGVDPSDGMRGVAETRRGIETVRGTADALPVENASFDFVLMGYALRHVADLSSSFQEMKRVLRPGGKVVILEIAPPTGRFSRALVKFYMQRIVPPASMLVTRSRKTRLLMRYYWDSIEQCVKPQIILDAMQQADLRAPARTVTMGFLTEYIASAP